MSNEPKPKTRKMHPDRLTVNSDALERLDNWINLLTEKAPGVHITKNALLNWLILSRDPVLTILEEKNLFTEFYDEERFIRYALQEIRAAKKSGSSLTLQEILNQKATQKDQAKEMRTRQKRHPRVTREEASDASTEGSDLSAT